MSLAWLATFVEHTRRHKCLHTRTSRQSAKRLSFLSWHSRLLHFISLALCETFAWRSGVAINKITLRGLKLSNSTYARTWGTHQRTLMLAVYWCVNQASVVALCEVLNELVPCWHLLSFAMLSRWSCLACVQRVRDSRSHIVAFEAAACAANLFLVHWAMVGRHAWSLCANTLSLYSRQRQACGNFMSLGVSKSNAGNTIAMNYLEITENFDKGNFTCLILMA